ncbi:pyridoxamine 5'-phosphate oxidase family protein [Chordicoccus furentiruminis]|jgi:hypothetical protein|uniref:pyridoxamine 5'-phosphate oxidase family protein n=1 Tax=Chordicoccus furentiruminis TaxID=2709410 RepID=UPI0023A7B72B|nr:pyridoxamine 5'-phosphate oxidase family protein [Chordicoccus furentiruminis]
MIKTLLLYDGRMSSAERIADRLCYLIGNARVAEITEAPEDLTPYEGFCFVFNFYGTVTAGRTRSYLTAHAHAIDGRRIIMVGIGFSDLGYTKYVTDSEKAAGISGISGIFIQSENETLRAGYEIGRILHEPVNEMEEHKLMDRIESFIRSHQMLALATAGQGYVRCTPLEYMYLDRVFYVITEGGNKFRGILENGDVSAAIFDPIGRTGRPVVSLQILAKAAPVPVGSDEYRIAMAARGLTEQKLDQMPVTLFLLKIVPLRYEFLNTAFTDEGYDAKQLIDTEFRRKTWEAGAAYATKEEARRAAKASAGLKAEAAAAKANREAEKLRIPDVTEEPAVSEADADAAKVVKEIFTEVETAPEETGETADVTEDAAEPAADLSAETSVQPSDEDDRDTGAPAEVSAQPSDEDDRDGNRAGEDLSAPVTDGTEQPDEPLPEVTGPEEAAGPDPEAEEVTGTVEPTEAEEPSVEAIFASEIEEDAGNEPDEAGADEAFAFEADVYGPETEDAGVEEEEEPENGEIIDGEADAEPEDGEIAGGEAEEEPEDGEIAGGEAAEEPEDGEIIDGEAKEEPEDGESAGGEADAEPEDAEREPADGGTAPIRPPFRPEDNDSDFLRSPLIDTQHLPQIDMSVLEPDGASAHPASGERDEENGKPDEPDMPFAADLEKDGREEAAAPSETEESEKKEEKHFGLAELEAMEDEEEAENELDEEAYERQLAELRRKAGRPEGGRRPARRSRTGAAHRETSSATERVEKPDAKSSRKSRPGRASRRKPAGFFTRLKELLLIEPEDGESGDEDEE